MAKSHEEVIETLVSRVKGMMVKLDNIDTDPCLFLSPSAYDTAWLTMVSEPDTERESKPMFEGCLDWILKNQKPEGFWGECDYKGYPTIDSLPSTLTCMIALNKWNVGHNQVLKGMEYISSSSSKLLLNMRMNEKEKEYPRWFALVFPAMVQLARDSGLRLTFPADVTEVVADLFSQRHNILQVNFSEKQADKKYDHYPPLLAYLEVLPTTYKIDSETILSNLDCDGSLFRSPSATAAAFLVTKNHQTLSYLRRLLQCCAGGVPSIYPVDVDNIRLHMVNEIERLGLLDHFLKEDKDILEHIYRKYNDEEMPQRSLVPANILKESIAFQLFRLQGYKVSSKRLCWFLHEEGALEYIEKNHEKLSSMVYNLYRATNLMFQEEEELQHLRPFLTRLLKKSSLNATINDAIFMWPHLQQLINHELSTPWMARMDHLENRKWIEESNKRSLWLGKASYYRILFIDNKDLLQLAKKNYEHRQSIYKKEFEEILRWSKDWGLRDIGFAREKTLYCYFAIASSISFPCHCDVRTIGAKIGVLITIADDFFDEEGSLNDLVVLTKAVERWNGKGLTSHSKLIFDVLDETVTNIANKYLNQHGINIMSNLQQMWYEAFSAWLMEATWSKQGKLPSMASYIETGMISVAAQIIVLQGSCCLTPTISLQNVHPPQYQDITKFLMLSCRLLNDLQSYEKEMKDGKYNSVMLYLKENLDADMEEAVGYVQSMLDKAKMKMLEHALIDKVDDLPRSCKSLHLSMLKIFEMFFNSTNHFDSKDSLLVDIDKAIFIPLE